MIELFTSLSTESKMIAVLAVVFAVSVAWSNKDKLKGLIPSLPQKQNSQPDNHDLLDSYMMLMAKARVKMDKQAIDGLKEASHIIFELPVKETIRRG